MVTASAPGWKASPCCFSQYCIIMTTLAAPQPSFACLTNGTSSQMPEGAAAHSTPQTPVQKTMTVKVRYNMTSAHGDDDQNQCCDGNQNNDQISIGKSSGSKVSLSFLR